MPKMPIPVAALSKAWVFGSELAGMLGSNPAGGHVRLSPFSIVCYQVHVSATG